MVADVLRDAINLIKVSRMIEARELLEPFIVANPQNIQAWIWEIETRENDAEKIKIMEACLLHNPDSTLIKKALAALKTRQEFLVPQNEKVSPFTTESLLTQEPLDKTDEPVEDETPVKENPCPYCGAMVKEGAGFCDSCGRELTTPTEGSAPVEEKARKQKKWYRRIWFKVLVFILLLPLWCVIELGDPDARRGSKILAGIILVFFINLISLFLYWFFTTNSSRANLFNLYQYLTGQSSIAQSNRMIRVQGNVQNSGTTPFSMVELQAKVYDKNGNLLGNNTRYLDSTSLLPGAPAQFQLDVTSLTSSINGGLGSQPLLFFDDFSNPNSNWTNSKTADGTAGYFEGKYRLTVNNVNFDLWSNPGLKFTDAKIEVDATKLAGPESNRFGIQCRNKDDNNYYFAVISSDGYYGIGKVVDGSESFLNDTGMLVTDKVYAGSTLNHIRFDCVGTRLTLYVNGDYVDAVDDSSLTSGDVGLLAGTFDKKGTQIAFDNFVVANP
jgi:hypothetical protein